MDTRKKGKIAHKILWPFLIIFALLIISLVGSLGNFVNEQVRLIILHQAETKLNVARQHFENSKQTMLSEMRELSSLISPMLLEQAPLPIIKNVLRSITRFHRYSIIQVYDPNGGIIMETGQDETGGEGHLCFDSFLQHFEGSASEWVSIKGCDTDLAINLFMPIQEQGKSIGFVRLFRQFGHHLCQEIQREVQVPVYLFINDRVIPFPDTHIKGASINLPPYVFDTALQKQPKIVERVYIEDKEHIAGFLPFEDPHSRNVEALLMILMDTSLIRQLSAGIIRTGGFYGLVGICILAFMGILIAKGLTLPLVDLVGMTRRVGEGDLDVTISTGSNDELGELADAFNRMAKRLNETTVSRDFVDNIIESMMDLLFVVDRDGRIQMANKAVGGALGYGRDEIIGMMIGDLLQDKEDISLLPCGVHGQCTEAEDIKDYETYMTGKDGKSFPVLFSKSVMQDKAGGVMCAVCTAKDISLQKLAEQKIRENQEYLKRILDSIQTGIMIIEGDTDTIFDVNPVAAEMIGAAKEAIVGSPGRDYFTQDNWSAQEKGIIGVESLLVTSQGTRVPILMSQNNIVLNGRGYLLRAFLDITERKRIEEAVRQSELAKAERERLFSLLETMPALMFLLAPDYSVPFANRTFREVFGEPGGRPCYEILHGRKEPCETCTCFRVFEKNEMIKWEWTNARGRSYEFYDCPYTDIDGSPLVIELGIDITDRKEAEEARKQVERKLEEQRAKAILSDRLRSLGEMATGIAHELNQPLSGVRGLAEHILIGFNRGWRHSEETIRENVEMIIEQTDRMTHVIEHTRLFARGAEDSELVPVQVNEVIGSALGLIGAQLRARGLVVQCELGAGLPAVLANPFSLEEVILNLLNNARDALMEKEGEGTPDNTPQVMIRTGETGKDSLRFVSIDVIDQGTGIPREVLGKVFDPFFTTKSPDRGTGLGLAVSKSIVEGFKGSIAIRSKPGKGTTVSVYLPAIQENKEQDNG